MLLPAPSRDGYLEKIPKKLIDIMKQGKAGIFLGSDFLEPPRHERMSDIMERVGAGEAKVQIKKSDRR